MQQVAVIPYQRFLFGFVTLEIGIDRLSCKFSKELLLLAV